MTTRNDITGDSIQSKSNSKKFRDNYDTIFGKKNPVKKNMDKLHKPATHIDKKKESKKN